MAKNKPNFKIVNPQGNEPAEQPSVQEKKPVTNDMLYEGLIVLDLKLQHLVDVLDKIAGYVEDKRNGTLS